MPRPSPRVDPRAALAQAMAEQRVSIVATLIRQTGDWELAEDSVQDAAARALEHWPAEGVPDNPAGWLTTVARRRAVDVLRRRSTERAKLAEVMIMDESSSLDPSGADAGPEDPYGDDRLRLIFTCCHPALSLAGRVALTLKTVAGLSTGEIARAFLTSEATMSQRLLRARTKISNAGLPYRVPPAHRLAERTAGVLAVIYLIFNQGYGEPGRHDRLAAEAVRLSGLLAGLLPGEPEVLGLRALLLFQQSRLAARTDAAGDLVAMEDQDRRRWDHTMIMAGSELLLRARVVGAEPPGSYRLQAEIAARHALAADPESTDWKGIVDDYDQLLALTGSPVVALNRAVALAFRDGWDVGLAEIDRSIEAGELGGYRLLPAIRADLLRRAGRAAEARTAYLQALDLADSEAERRYLRRRSAELPDD